MKTKQFIFSALLCGPLSFLTMQSQGIYFGVGGGYGFAAAKQSLFDDYKTTSTATGATIEYTAHPFSLGKGINAGLYVGHMFNENIGAELGYSYLIGSKNVFTDDYTNSVTGTSYKSEMNWKGRMMRLVPAMRITAGKNKLHPYMKAGLIIGVGGKMYSEEHTEDISTTSTVISDEEWEYSGGVSWGFHGGIGVNFMLNEKIGIFGEVAGNYQNWAMKKGTMTKNTVGGVDQLSMMDINDKETEFVDSYTYDSSATPNPGQPDKETKFYLPFSSIGINIGLNISLGGKKE